MPSRSLALRALARVRAEVKLTLLSFWRGFTGFYNSDDLTFAASIAYYALLSLFPFFLLAFSILGSVTADEADRATALNFVLRYFPRQLDFLTRQLDSLRQSTSPARHRRQHHHDLGGDGGLRRRDVRYQSRLGRRAAAELLQTQADLAADAGGVELVAARWVCCS